MKNIHVLPTDKPSRLFVSSRDGKIKLTGHTKDFVGIKQHIYITNSEEIKEGDWMYYKHFGEDIVTKYNTWGGQNTNVNEHKDYYKKIILTNDSTLIKDGVQAIDNEFLEWFVKNPSCERVEVNIEGYPCMSDGSEITFAQPANLGGSEDIRNNIVSYNKQEHTDTKNFVKAYDKKRYKIKNLEKKI